ncbi:MAG: protein translocase subunit SecF [Anaerolineae bacterium]|nr:MAG: protein translocase subunit SecF [Anaerolineae bacterium]
MLNIVKRRYLYFAISLIVIVPGLIAYLLWGLPLAIDFTGGSLLEVQFNSSTAPDPTAVIELYTAQGFEAPRVQSSNDGVMIIRSKFLDNDARTQLLNAMQEQFGDITVLRFDSVGPTVGKEVTTRATGAVAFAAIFIMLYITWAFRGVPHALRYGVSAILAMLHDVAVVVGLSAIFGKFLGWEIDSLFLTALLTVIGFSVHDSIVVFDRIRENSTIYRRLPYETLVNHSIVQTLDRSINTQLTVMFTLLALALFGGETTRHFVVTLLVGVSSGTYSSIFNAAPILVVWENKEWRNWFNPVREANAS